MPLEDELSLDVAPALQGIGTIDDALQQVVDSFKVGLADALSLLNAPQEVPIEADTEALTAQTAEAIEAGASESIVLDVDEASLADQVAAGIDEGAADQSVTIEADVVVDQADVEGLSEELGGLDDAAAGAGASLGGANAAAGAFATTVALGQGNTAALTSRLGGLSGALGVAAGAGLAFGGFLSSAIEQGRQAERAQFRYNQSLGEFADEVTNINVGGLDADLSELAITIGATDEKLQLAAARIFDLGRTSGRSGDDIALATEQVLALSASLAVANPTLGDAGDVADTLTLALARGGRALGRFGIALSTEEINARAFRDTGKTTADQLTIFDKAAAGAAIQTERLGDSLGEDLRRGAEQADIRLASLRVRLEETIEAAGVEVLDEFVSVAEDLAPVVVDLARVFGDLTAAVLPAAAALADAAVPALEGAVKVIDFAVTVVTPFIGIIEALPDPLLQAAGGMLLLGKVTGTTGTALSALGAALPALTVASGGLVAVLAAGAVFAQDFFGPKPQDFADEVARVAEGLFAAGGALDQAEGRAVDFRDSILDVISAQQDFEEGFGDPAIIDTLDMLGVSLEDVARFLQRGTAGQESFNAALERGARAASPTGRITDQLRGNIDSLNGQYLELQGTLQDQARQYVDLAVSEGRLAASSRDALVARNSLTDGTINYVAVAQQAATLVSQEAAAIDTQRNALDGTLPSYLNLTRAVGDANVSFGALALSLAQGQLDMTNLAATASFLGVSVEQVQAFSDALTASVQRFTDTATGALPTAQQALQSIDDGLSPDAFVEKLNQITADTLIFTANIQTITRQGFEETAAFLAEQGPEAAGELARQLIEAGPGALREFESSLRANVRARNIAAEAFEEMAPGLITRAEQTAIDASEVFGRELDFAKPTGAALDIAQSLLVANDELTSSARIAAREVGVEWGEGMAGGVIASSPAVEDAVRTVVLRAEIAAREAAQSDSPSRLFRDVGLDFGAGMAIGMSESVPAVRAAANDLVRAAVVDVQPATLRVDGRSSSGVDAATFGATGAAPTVVRDAPIVGQLILNEKVDPLHVAAAIGFEVGEP